ncbi:MAG: hypothetical protein RMX96_30870 [Nostoc sp. ChiSLP02]|nr:hypothetical protein [Nostoc sp. DedSLP05]MDZ8103630.1 hypothetical protein [Nostoc sp. DedSLP01]MDZ8189229.1 hypothetical protein [Nostoc sp. ChiSLP02]
MSQLIQSTLQHTPKLEPYIELTTKREVRVADGSPDFPPLYNDYHS